MGELKDLIFEPPEEDKLWEYSFPELGVMVIKAREDVGEFPKDGSVQVIVDTEGNISYKYFSENGAGKRYFSRGSEF